MMIQISGKSTNFGSKMLVRSKKKLMGKVQSFQSQILTKPRIQNSANTKQLTTDMLYIFIMFGEML